MRIKKLKAGTLQTAVFVVVIIAIILTCTILLLHTHSKIKWHQNQQITAIDLCEQGVQWSLSHDIVNLNFVKFENEEVKIIRRKWGIFDLLIASATISGKSYEKAALIGGYQSLEDRPVLYLNDDSKPLVVVGETQIQGDAYLPMAGIRPGSISGTSYYGSLLINGKSQVSNKTLKEIFDFSFDIDGLSKDSEFLNELPIRLSNSFLNPTKTFFSDETIDLKLFQISGNVIIRSSSKIIISKSSLLKDIVLFAPEIVIEDDVKGNFQAIATDLISVGKSCNLSYPTGIFVEKTPLEIQGKIPSLVIKSNSNINGVVGLKCEEIQIGRTDVLIEPNATISGELYCNGNLEMKGIIHGTSYVNNFLRRFQGTTYQNHLLDATLDVTELSEHFVGFQTEKSSKRIIKWLY